MSLKTRKRS